MISPSPAPAPTPVIVTNFPEQYFDWVGFSSLVIAVVALGVAVWSIWLSRKLWQLEGPVLKGSARLRVRSNSAIGDKDGNHYSLSVFVANTGRSSIQCLVSAIEFYEKSDPSKLIRVSVLNEKISIDSGHYWEKEYVRSDLIAELRQGQEEISRACLLLMTAFNMERHDLDAETVDYINRLIRNK